MPSATLEIEKSKPSPHWQPQPDVITANDVIDAYFKGKEDGKTEYTDTNLIPTLKRPNGFPKPYSGR